eukprot:CAMPEP_0113575544 /NCGR_PEP_ID=MMETSP0015_2-20120614/27759_1 /TAXON_ID=2838 /ORGANISM="Odontella" /LENGTH=164 /DNA_ID=CAMNT_0000478799 /DNA_START=108 /DNA_END=599 /DNA_ORIENTATION=+ /assembly_acc=CAM_ASM_000160
MKFRISSPVLSALLAASASSIGKNSGVGAFAPLRDGGASARQRIRSSSAAAAAAASRKERGDNARSASPLSLGRRRRSRASAASASASSSALGSTVSKTSAMIADIRNEIAQDEDAALVMQALRGSNMNDDDAQVAGLEMKLIDVGMNVKDVDDILPYEYDPDA